MKHLLDYIKQEIRLKVKNFIFINRNEIFNSNIRRDAMSLNEKNEINEGKSVAEEKKEVKKFAYGTPAGRGAFDCPSGTEWDPTRGRCMLTSPSYYNQGGKARSAAKPAPQRRRGGPVARPASRTLSGGSRGGGLR
jgi:hypothetical protein